MLLEMFDKIKELLNWNSKSNRNSEFSEKKVNPENEEKLEELQIKDIEDNLDNNRKISDWTKSEIIFQEDNEKEEKSKKIDKNINEALQETLIFNSVDQIKYQIIEISRIFLWRIPQIEVDAENEKLDITFNDFVLSVNLEEFLLEILYKYKDKWVTLWYIKEQISLFDWKIFISFYNWPEYFKIYFNTNKWKFLNKEELQLIKNIFESEIFNKLVYVWEQNVTKVELIKFVNDFKDKLIFEENDWEYYLKILGNINISDFERLVQDLANQDDKLYIKILPSWVGSNVYELKIAYRRSWSTIDETMILLKLEGDKTNFKIKKVSQDIREIFLKPLIQQLIDFMSKEKTSEVENYINDLMSIGLKVDLPEDAEYGLEELIDKYWFVWYEDVKEEILANVINPRKEKDKYLKFANKNVPYIWSEILPNAVLFWWPPGTGKTTVSRIIWKYLKYPFVYLPIQSIISKWYWKSERILNWIFKRVEKIWQYYWWVILMIDEIDEIGRNRDDSHEATARLTGILLRKLDGLEKVENVLLI